MSNIKPKIIRTLNPIRRFYSKLYTFVLASYLGRIIIELNQIDHTSLDWVFYFCVFNPKKEGIKEYYRLISSQPMGTKLGWLIKIYKGIWPFDFKKGSVLKIDPNVVYLEKNKTLGKIIDILTILINDTRNPLVHSHYALGFGNEYEWGLSYSRHYFNKNTNDFENSLFHIKDAKKYLVEVQETRDALMKLFARLLNEQYPI